MGIAVEKGFQTGGKLIGQKRIAETFRALSRSFSLLGQKSIELVLLLLNLVTLLLDVRFALFAAVNPALQLGRGAVHLALLLFNIRCQRAGRIFVEGGDGQEQAQDRHGQEGQTDDFSNLLHLT